MKQILLSGVRPTGKMHLGHLVGSLNQCLQYQDDERFNQFIFIADMQALTDNAFNPNKIRQSLLEVGKDFLAIGLDPSKNTIFVQSQVPALAELSMYYSNFTTVARCSRNPTIKTEIKERGFQNDIPVGFLSYPISQASDITAFQAKYVPGGEDQVPIIEQAREIVKTFNSHFGEVLTMPEIILEKDEKKRRLIGTDGAKKMSKSIGNCIYISDDMPTIKQKIMAMYTDPNHIRVEDAGQVEGNVVFSYLDVFWENDSFSKFLPEYANLDELKAHYRRGGLGDVKIKNFLYKILEEKMLPIYERRLKISDADVFAYLEKGNQVANIKANETLEKVKDAIGINYFKEFKLTGKIEIRK